MKCALIEVEFKFMYCIPQCMYVQQIKTLHQYCTNTVKHCWGWAPRRLVSGFLRSASQLFGQAAANRFTNKWGEDHITTQTLPLDHN